MIPWNWLAGALGLGLLAGSFWIRRATVASRLAVNGVIVPAALSPTLKPNTWIGLDWL